MYARPIGTSADFRRTILIRTALVVAGSMLMALGARVSFDIGTVPVTGQTLALPLVVALLGTRQSVCAMLVYLGEGALGMPVFAPQDHAGVAVLIGPTATTAGYLWAYPAAAWVIGTLMDRGFARRYVSRWAAILAGTTLIFVGGYAVLALLLGPKLAFALGVAPFVAGDVVKISIAALAPSAWPRIASLLRL